MIEVIPAVNAATWEEVVKKIRRVESFSKWAHIDVADGTFTPNAIWHNPLDLVGFDTPAHLEIHLMEDRPEERIEAWIIKPVKRIIVHYEVAHDLDFIFTECWREKIEVGIAISPHSSWTLLKPFESKAHLFQILAVHPGLAGQEFERHNLSKIKHLRAHCPDCKIEVDGGITPKIAEECIKAGANIIVSASYIFNHPSPKLAIKELQS